VRFWYAFSKLAFAEIRSDTVLAHRPKPGILVAMCAQILGCLALSIFGTTQVADSDPRSAKNTLVRLERLWNEAQVNRDARAIRSMIGEHFINTEYDGEVSNRDKFLADFADPEYQPSAINIDNVEVELYDDVAVVTGAYHTKGTYHRKPYEHFGRFTDTWIRRNEKWQCIASHTSLVKGKN
jgi:ketosteroid isomerase-like protein